MMSILLAISAVGILILPSHPRASSYTDTILEVRMGHLPQHALSGRVDNFEGYEHPYSGERGYILMEESNS